MLGFSYSIICDPSMDINRLSMSVPLFGSCGWFDASSAARHPKKPRVKCLKAFRSWGNSSFWNSLVHISWCEIFCSSWSLQSCDSLQSFQILSVPNPNCIHFLLTKCPTHHHHLQALLSASFAKACMTSFTKKINEIGFRTCSYVPLLFLLIWYRLFETIWRDCHP